MIIKYQCLALPKGVYQGTMTSNHVRFSFEGRTYGFFDPEIYVKGVDCPVTVEIVHENVAKLHAKRTN